MYTETHMHNHTHTSAHTHTLYPIICSPLKPSINMNTEQVLASVLSTLLFTFYFIPLDKYVY